MKWPPYLDKNYGYDAGHGLMGIFLGMLIFAFGWLPAWACALIGGCVYAVPKEIKDILRRKRRIPNVDNVSDFVSYQLIWPLVYAAELRPLLAAGLLLVIAAVYLLLVYIKTEGEM